MKREGLSIQVNWSQVVTSLVIGALIGAFAIVRLSDTQSVILAAHAKSIEKLENGSVSSELFQHYSDGNREAFQAINKRLDAFESNDREIINLLNQMRVR